MPTCSKGHEMTEISRKTISETSEDVVYRRERIKHFDREGSEFWTEIDVPDLIERKFEIDLVVLQCSTCAELMTLREPRT
jgi:hypothetical protein